MNPGEDDLLVTSGCHAADLGKCRLWRKAPPGSAGRRDDAVGARLGAPGLHAQGEGGSPGNSGLERGPIGRPGTPFDRLFDHGAAGAVAIAEASGRGQLIPVSAQAERYENGFVVVRDHQAYVGQLADLVLPPGRIAAGDNDPRRIVCLAPWSAVAVTEHVLMTTRSASEGAAATAPAARNCSSKPSESAWFTRQPKVITEYFMAPLEARGGPG